LAIFVNLTIRRNIGRRIRSVWNSVRLVKKAVGVERRRRENQGAVGAEGEGRGEEGVSLPTGEGPGEGALPCPSPKYCGIFYFKIVHSEAFSYTNSKVLFAIKCREKYVIAVLRLIQT